MHRSSRRDVLKAFGALAAAASAPRLALASAPGAERLVLIVLRGGMDGLSAVPAHGDPDYARARGELAVPPPGAAGGAHRLDDLFGLHPALSAMHGLYRSGELAVLHAAATPYRERSHFDGQNLLENGTARPFGRDAGWLSVALAQASRASGLALGTSVPLLLRGPGNASSWSPSILPEPDSELLDRLAPLYRDDPLLARPFAAARGSRDTAEGQGRGNPGGAQAVVQLARAAGTFLARDDGPRVATLDFGGWDTHANQAGELGPLARRLRVLDLTFATLKEALGPAWRQSVVLAVTEFGRTVAPNGSRGTDHGTASAAFAAGGKVRGGRVIADWPGVAARALHEGRDLRPTLDLRALFKAALAAQLGLGETALETLVFPGSPAARPLEGLFA